MPSSLRPLSSQDEVEWREVGQKSVFDSVARQETQLAVLGTVVRALYTVQGIWNVLHYDATWKTLETYGRYYRRCWNTMEYHPELDRKERKHVETTGIIQGLGLVNPHSYPCCHAQPCDLWC